MSTDSLNSIGFVCQTLQKPPGVIRRAIEAMGIKPAVVLNGVDHFNDAQVEQISQFIANPKKAKPPAGQQKETAMFEEKLTAALKHLPTERAAAVKDATMEFRNKILTTLLNAGRPAEETIAFDANLLSIASKAL